MSRAISSLDWRGANGPAETVVLRNARALDPRAEHRLGPRRRHPRRRIAELAARRQGRRRRRRGRRRGRPPRRARLLRPARPSAHPGARGQGGHRDGQPRRSSRWLLRDHRHGEHRAAGRHARRHRVPPRARADRRHRSPSASSPPSPAACAARSSPTWRSFATPERVGFSDDGLPIRSARVMRRALQYQALAGLQIALHEEDPDLSGKGVMHEGEVAALLGMAGVPSVSESTMIARDCALAAYENARIHVQHLSARESVEVVEAAKAQGVQITCEATPHHLTLTDDAVRSLDSRFKMNPPLRSEDDRQALIEAVRSGLIDTIATDHAPAHARGQGGPVRGGRDGRHRPRDGLRRPQHRPGRPRDPRPRHGDRAPLGRSHRLRLRRAQPRRPTPRRTSRSSTSTPSGRREPTAGRAARRTPASPGASSRAARR